jgi:hypothetical protein
MMPFGSDPDSNFAIDIICNRGTLQRPTWPLTCLAALQCTNPPVAADDKFMQRVDNRLVVTQNICLSKNTCASLFGRKYYSSE